MNSYESKQNTLSPKHNPDKNDLSNHLTKQQLNLFKYVDMIQLQNNFLIGKRIKSDQQLQEDNNYSQITEEYYNRLNKCHKSLNSENFILSENDLSCPICDELYIEPVITICGHIFCEKCLHECLIASQVCAICREQLRFKKLNKNKVLRSLVQNFFESKLDSAQQQNYFNRQKEIIQEIKARKVINPTIGMKLDILDTELIYYKHVWCEGEIVQIFNEFNPKIPKLLIHYTNWDKIYDEVISLNSYRIANYGVYTQRPNIPKYRAAQQVQFLPEINQPNFPLEQMILSRISNLVIFDHTLSSIPNTMRNASQSTQPNLNQFQFTFNTNGQANIHRINQQNPPNNSDVNSQQVNNNLNQSMDDNQDNIND